MQMKIYVYYIYIICERYESLPLVASPKLTFSWKWTNPVDQRKWKHLKQMESDPWSGWKDGWIPNPNEMPQGTLSLPQPVKGFHQSAMCCPAAPLPRPPMTWEVNHGSSEVTHIKDTSVNHSANFTLPEFSFDVSHWTDCPSTRWPLAYDVHSYANLILHQTIGSSPIPTQYAILSDPLAL